MSQFNSPPNPTGSDPADGPSGATPIPQSPFEILDGEVAGGQAPASSPFEAVGEQPSGPLSNPGPQGAPASPFQIAENQAYPSPQSQPQPRPVPQPVPQGAGGFPMTGFPPGPAPVGQLDAAPIQASNQPEQSPAGDGQPTIDDPFAGMDLPQAGERSQPAAVAAAELEKEATKDFAAPVRNEPAPAPEPAPTPDPTPVAQRRPEPEPTPAPEPAPAPRAEAKDQPSFAPDKPVVEESVTSETKQLELRAIFGVDHELSQLEIMQRARGLPGILNVSKANSKEVEALGLLKGCASKLGLEENDPVVMSSPQGFIDFVSCEGTSLAVLREGKYAPGVRETLIICARELDKL